MTDGARRALEKAGLLPKRPPPFGSLFLYEKVKPVVVDKLKALKWNGTKIAEANMDAKLLVEEEKERIYKNDVLGREALERGKLMADKSQLDTTDIEANDSDIESRLESFAEISRRLRLHLDDMGEACKGSDYKTAAYVRKLNLLAKKGKS
jgi:hypothetical protein